MIQKEFLKRKMKRAPESTSGFQSRQQSQTSFLSSMHITKQPGAAGPPAGGSESIPNIHAVPLQLSTKAAT